MSSNYFGVMDMEKADEVEDSKPRLIRCSTCHGSGLEIVHDQETDCIDCEGEGYVEV